MKNNKAARAMRNAHAATQRGNASDTVKDLENIFRHGASLCRREHAGKWDPVLDFEDELAIVVSDLGLKLGERRGYLNAAADISEAPLGARSVRRE